MALIVANSICQHLEKTNNAKGIYQSEVIKILLKSNDGTFQSRYIINQIMKNPLCQVNECRLGLKTHRVWGVLAKKGLIKIDHSTGLVHLVGFEDLNNKEKNDVRNSANKARRAITDFREGGYTLE